MDDVSCRATCQTNFNDKISIVCATESVTITTTITQSIQNVKLRILLTEHNCGSHTVEKRHQYYWMPWQGGLSALICRTVSTMVLISSQPDQEGNKLQRHKILSFIYSIYGAWSGVVVKALCYQSDGPGDRFPAVSLGIFFPVVPSTEPCALRSTQPLKVSTRDFTWSKGGRCVWLTTYHPCSAETSRKSGALTYPAPLGPPRPVAGHLYFSLYFTLYPIYNHNWRTINTIHIYIYILYIYITNEIFQPSNKIHREIGRAKDLSAPL